MSTSPPISHLAAGPGQDPVAAASQRVAVEPLASPESFKRKAYSALKDVIAAMDPAVGTPVRGESPVELAHQRLKARVPEDLEDRVTVRVEIGDPAEKIAEVAERVGASCLFMGAHARGFLRRIFTRDTSLALLHKAPCPVWFVPEVRAA